MEIECKASVVGLELCKSLSIQNIIPKFDLKVVVNMIKIINHIEGK